MRRNRRGFSALICLPAAALGAIMATSFATKLPANFLPSNRPTPKLLYRGAKKDCSESMCYRPGSYYQDRDYKVLRTCSYRTKIKCFERASPEKVAVQFGEGLLP